MAKRKREKKPTAATLRAAMKSTVTQEWRDLQKALGRTPAIAVLIGSINEPTLKIREKRILAFNLFPGATMMTDVEKAKVLDVPIRSYIRISRSEKVRERLDHYVRNVIPSLGMPKALAALERKVEEGETAAIKLWMEWHSGKMGREVGPVINVAVIEQERHEKLRTGLTRFGVQVLEGIDGNG